MLKLLWEVKAKYLKVNNSIDDDQDILDFCLMVNIHHTFVNKRLRKTLFTYLPKLE